jgi:hypothetical protein
LLASEGKVVELQASYKDTVPRYEHELLQAEHDSYKSRFETQRDLTVKMHQQVLEMQQKHEQFIRDLEKRYAERLRNATPDWEYISKRCSGNVEAFWRPCNGLNCNETIVKLIHLCLKGKIMGAQSLSGAKGRGSTSSLASDSLLNVAGNTDPFADAGSLRAKRDSEEKGTYFIGQGVSSSTPRYLR